MSHTAAPRRRKWKGFYRVRAIQAHKWSSNGWELKIDWEPNGKTTYEPSWEPVADVSAGCWAEPPANPRCSIRLEMLAARGACDDSRAHVAVDVADAMPVSGHNRGGHARTKPG